MALAARALMGSQTTAASGGQRVSHYTQGGASGAETGPVESSASYTGISYGGEGSGSGFQFSGDSSHGFQHEQRQQRPLNQGREPFTLFATPTSTFASLFGVEHDVTKTDGKSEKAAPFAAIRRGAVHAYEKTAMVISGMQSPLGGSLSMRL